MRLKNFPSIAFLIAKRKRRECPFDKRGMNGNKKNANERPRYRSIALLNRKMNLLRQSSDVLQSPVGIRFLSALPHVLAERAIVLAHVGATRNAVHTSLDNATFP